jgi:hypothetical protein
LGHSRSAGPGRSLRPGAIGQGEDAARASAAERTRWRRHALEWLRGELTAWDKAVLGMPARVYPAVQQELRHWQQDADLTGLRDPEAVARLPDDEQEVCRKFVSGRLIACLAGYLLSRGLVSMPPRVPPSPP